MQLLSALIPLFAALVAASPASAPAAPSPHAGEVSRVAAPPSGTFSTNAAAANGGVFFCDNAGFNSPCLYRVYPTGQCINVEIGWNDKISAFGPDQGTHCFIYKDINCSGDSRSLFYPGSQDLTELGFNDVLTSFACT